MIGRRLVAGAILAAALVGACAPAPAARLEVVLDGEVWEVLPATPDGMRGRDDFGGADGMLFDLGGPTDPSAVVFVMDGVAFPLDIGWFAEDGTFLGWTEMPVCDAAPCPRYQAHAPFRWAIEAPPGAFDDISAGARLEVAP